MNVKSLEKYVLYDNSVGLYDLSIPTFIFRNDVPVKEFTVSSYNEMRIDLIFKEMYELDDNEVGLYLSDVDVILYINNIDNPINIVQDMVLYYPATLKDISSFRYERSNLDEDILQKKEKVSVPSKSTKIDPSRKNYLDNNYLLPPVVQQNTKPPVRIENGKFYIGGI